MKLWISFSNFQYSNRSSIPIIETAIYTLKSLICNYRMIDVSLVSLFNDMSLFNIQFLFVMS